MALENQLNEFSMTADEVDRFKEAFRDDTFRKMLREYAQEISDPENKKMYEEDIKRLEQERGNTIEFIHPEPFRSIKTSMNGEMKCFINICGNGKVGKPECKSVVSKDGRRGSNWSLPHTMHPGREDTDGKGKKITIYDVVFHPDTLQIASKSQRFMDVVESTAIQAIQQTFKVTLDMKNMKAMKTKYKGTPQACVLRKSIPGFVATERLEQPDPLAFPYPDEKTPASVQQSELPQTNSSNVKTIKAKEPTKPKHWVKYRSSIDLQDFASSKALPKRQMPKEIVVTIDLPLLKSAMDANLEVKDKVLLLESTRPAYRLELPLAYPVDEDKGEAKFNKQTGQLVVTLPVRPLFKMNNLPDGGFQSVVDGESEGESHKIDEDLKKEKGIEDTCVEKEEKETDVKVEREVEEGKEEESEEDGSDKEEASIKQNEQNAVKDEQESNKQEQVDKEDVDEAELQKTEKLEDTCDKLKAFEAPVEPEKTKEENLQVTNDAASRDESLTTAAVPFTPSLENSADQNKGKVNSISRTCETSSQISATDEASKTNPEGSEKIFSMVSEDLVADSAQLQEIEDRDEDDLPEEQSFPTTLQDNVQPAVILREIDEDGNETVIQDHSTSAGFIFQNTLTFELD